METESSTIAYAAAATHKKLSQTNQNHTFSRERLKATKENLLHLLIYIV